MNCPNRVVLEKGSVLNRFCSPWKIESIKLHLSYLFLLSGEPLPKKVKGYPLTGHGMDLPPLLRGEVETLRTQPLRPWPKRSSPPWRGERWWNRQRVRKGEQLGPGLNQ